MNLLIDTNVVLDILLNRELFYNDAATIFDLSEQRLVKSYVSASAITDIYYIVQKECTKPIALEKLKDLLQVFYPATVSDTNIYQALDLNWDDFEDSLQYIVGENISADYIITRDPRDFSPSTIAVVTPEQFVHLLTGA
jgi:predicted nucleic acid-binding protein